MFNDQAEDAAWEKRQKLQDAVDEVVRASLYLREMQYEGRGRDEDTAQNELADRQEKLKVVIREIIPIPGYPDL